VGSSPTECDGILSSEWLTGVGTRTQPIRHATRSIPRTVDGSRLILYPTYHGADTKKVAMVEGRTGG